MGTDTPPEVAARGVPVPHVVRVAVPNSRVEHEAGRQCEDDERDERDERVHLPQEVREPDSETADDGRADRLPHEPTRVEGA